MSLEVGALRVHLVTTCKVAMVRSSLFQLRVVSPSETISFHAFERFALTCCTSRWSLRRVPQGWRGTRRRRRRSRGRRRRSRLNREAVGCGESSLNGRSLSVGGTGGRSCQGCNLRAGVRLNFQDFYFVALPELCSNSAR